MTGRVKRVGPVVRRPMGFWLPVAHGLLDHLESVRFPAPRLAGIEENRELLTWIEGISGSSGWATIDPDPRLRRWASFLRRDHDAVAGFQPPSDRAWSKGTRLDWELTGGLSGGRAMVA
jgi:hypothetical protein